MALLIGVAVCVILSLLLYLTHFIEFVHFPSAHLATQILQSVIIIAQFFVIKRLFATLIWIPYEKLRGKPAPRLFIDLGSWILLTVAVLCITVLVFEQPVISLFTFGGLISAGIAFALQSMVLDVFSGIVMDLERPYDIKDWLKIPDFPEGMVTKIGARVTTLVTMDNTSIIIPHGKLAQNPFINYSKPTPAYWDQIQIGLDHVVPIDRAERLMKAAIIHLKEVHNGKCHVWATSAVSAGIYYTVRYLVEDHFYWYQARSAVITAIADHLHRYGLRISESLGEYALTRGGRPYKEVDALDRNTVIAQVPLFTSLDEDIISHLCLNANAHFFREGETIITKGDAGDSMFIVGEGVAEVLLDDHENAQNGRKDTRIELGPWGGHLEKSRSHRPIHAGQYFGEMALLLGQQRSATVIAKTDVLLYEISKEMMTPLLKAHPEIAQHMSDMMARRQIELSHAMGKKAELEKQRELASTKILEGMKTFFDL
ncbi:MAG: hypothetical protein C0514_01490 [Candidatus Puniceispirillum sp.]|nr:hypothetical protein [Candidatus Puniceispirillum sp.]